MNDDFGEYQLSFTRGNDTDEISISYIRIFSLTNEEVTNINTTPRPSMTIDNRCYTLNGIQIIHPKKGICIKNGKKIIISSAF